ncbi:MAG: tRNA epoxyqueuosine(34) reductase QueG [Pseudomonadota bacterium]|nr:tRNA epoxyqueuosine(34) reductase QueG [Pseudomonadota bacterium]
MLDDPGTTADLAQLASAIRAWGAELGFQQVAITDTDLAAPAERLRDWLARGYHGDMAWMGSHGPRRWEPAQLVPSTQRVICARMDYLPPESNLIATLRNRDKAYISRYALGRDYHKTVRKRLTELARRIAAWTAEHPELNEPAQRPFVDSAPVLEKPLAAKAGLGWMGKHTLIINSEAGSWFFLGEIYTSLPLPVDEPAQPDRCGSCSACLSICPTDAFPAPYQLDARRCISYLTIEHPGAIPESLRPLMGNRVFGCDDCQAICPWNRYATASAEGDFRPRHGLADADLVDLFRWTEDQFEARTAGSPIRRIGYQRWRRNLAVGLGNGSARGEAIRALTDALEGAPPLVAEHITWALARLQSPDRDQRRPFPRIKSPRHD